MSLGPFLLHDLVYLQKAKFGDSEINYARNGFGVTVPIGSIGVVIREAGIVTGIVKVEFPSGIMGFMVGEEAYPYIALIPEVEIIY